MRGPHGCLSAPARTGAGTELRERALRARDVPMCLQGDVTRGSLAYHLIPPRENLPQECVKAEGPWVHDHGSAPAPGRVERRGAGLLLRIVQQ